MPYILNIDKLLPGDILLYRDNSELSIDIRKSAASNYSHAILYLGYHSFIEAVTDGVTLFSNTRYYFPDSCQLECRRLREFNGDLLERIVAEARTFCYRAFNIRGIYSIRDGTVIGQQLLNGQWNYPVFCTQLVGAAYLGAGIELNNQPLGSLSPLHIEQSSVLTTVPEFLFPITFEQTANYTNYE